MLEADGGDVGEMGGGLGSKVKNDGLAKTKTMLTYSQKMKRKSVDWFVVVEMRVLGVCMEKEKTNWVKRRKEGC